VSKFFPFTSPGTPPSPVNRSVLKRIIFFAAALLLLWVALQLKPAPGPISDTSSLYTENSDAVADPTAPIDEPAPYRVAPFLTALVLAALLAFAYYRYRRTSVVSEAPHPIELIAQQPLGPGQELRIVRCAGQMLLLGVTSNQISLIDRLPESLPETPAAPEPDPALSRPDFSTFLYRAIRSSSNGN
jgi:flagellar protein FliO/FliZ